MPAPGGHTRAFERMIECSWGTVAVLVSNEGARAILTQLPPFDRPIDVWLRANGRRFNIYQPRRGWFWQPFLKPSTVRAGKYTGDIPPLIHRIWIGSPIPLAFSDYWETWRHYHPQVFFHTWTDIEIIRVFGPRIAFAQTRAPVEMADFARLLILERFGGLYVDCDFECLRDCTPLMQTGAFIVATTSPGMPANGFMAATAGNAFVTTLVSEAKKRIMAGRPTLEAAGPQMVRDVLEASFITRHFPKPIRDDHRRTLGIAYGDTGIVALEPWVTFPYCWQAESPPADYGDAWAVHHWARSWWTTQQWNAHGKSFEMPSSRLRIRAC